MEKVFDGLARIGTHIGMWLKPVTVLLALASVFGAGLWTAAGASLAAVVVLRVASRAWLERRGLASEIPHLTNVQEEKPVQIEHADDLTYEIPRPPGALRLYHERLAKMQVRAQFTSDETLTSEDLATQAERLRKIVEFDLNHRAKLKNAWMSVKTLSVHQGSLEVVYEVVVQSWASATALLIAYPKAKEGYEKLVKDLGAHWIRYKNKLGPLFSLDPPQVVTLRLESEDQIRERLTRLG